MYNKGVERNTHNRKEINMFFNEEVEASAAALYDDGWRSKDRDELKKEYNMDDEWTDAICEKLKEYENK